MNKVVVRSLNDRLEAAPTYDMLRARDEQLHAQNTEMGKLRHQLEQAKMVRVRVFKHNFAHTFLFVGLRWNGLS